MRSRVMRIIPPITAWTKVIYRIRAVCSTCDHSLDELQTYNELINYGSKHNKLDIDSERVAVLATMMAVEAQAKGGPAMSTVIEQQERAECQTATRHSKAELHQVAWRRKGADYEEIELPSADAEVLSGVRWGHTSDFFTPAFWKYQSQAHRDTKRFQCHALGNTLVEEVSACLLGGFGIPAELGLAAFVRLRDEGLLSGKATRDELELALKRPFKVANTPRKYRFARQKAKYLCGAIDAVPALMPTHDGIQLRGQLIGITGIGPKTASWIVRNHLGSDDVAILDVHITRASIAAGVFPETADPGRSYFELEQRFLEFCAAIDEPASRLDAIMWDYMRRIFPVTKRAIPALQW